jgi:hypothetical protein
MPRWAPRVVARLRRLAAQGNIRFVISFHLQPTGDDQDPD